MTDVRDKTPRRSVYQQMSHIMFLAKVWLSVAFNRVVQWKHVAEWIGLRIKINMSGVGFPLPVMCRSEEWLASFEFYTVLATLP